MVVYSLHASSWLGPMTSEGRFSATRSNINYLATRNFKHWIIGIAAIPVYFKPSFAQGVCLQNVGGWVLRKNLRAKNGDDVSMIDYR